MTKIEATVEKLILPIVEKLGYYLYDIEYVKEGAQWYLRIYIDQDSGIDLDDCEKVSNQISEILDKEDPIRTQYFLEVSSCGLERHLREKKHYLQNLGKEIQVNLYKAVEKKKLIEGILKEVKEDTILVKTEEKEIEVKLENISLAKTIYNWEECENG